LFLSLQQTQEMQHNHFVNSFVQNKCRKKITIEYITADSHGDKTLSKSIQKIRRIKGKKIVICVSDHDFVETYIDKKRTTGQTDIQYITLQRYDGVLQQVQFFQACQEQTLRDFKSGKIRTLFILGCPYWDEVKDLEGIADTSVWINRNLSHKEYADALYYTIALGAEDTKCFVSTIFF
jgi:hypothetical protein